MTFLGHEFTDKDRKFSVIENYSTLTNGDEAKRFIAFCNYYRRFMPNFAESSPYPDFTKEFYITTDASEKACGAALIQEKQGIQLSIAYVSRAFAKGNSIFQTIYVWEKIFN